MAAGAHGAWIGTALLVASEAANVAAVRQRVVAAVESETIHTHTWDDVTQTAWPDQYPGRAIANRFSQEWHGRSKQLTEADRAAYNQARARGDFDVAVIYAGEAVGLIGREGSTSEIVEGIGEGAEAVLRRRGADLLA